jgi:hypothetical protein
MNVKKEVYDKCLAMVERELRDSQHKLIMNKYNINKLAKDQRILKAEIGELHKMKKLFNL